MTKVWHRETGRRAAGRVGRAALVAVAVAALGGCPAMLDPHGSQDTVASLGGEHEADRAMAALTRGDYSAAEMHAIAALRRNPKDPLALLAAGMAYQGTARYDLARQYYDVIISNRMPGTLTVAENGAMVPRSVVDVARANLAVVDRITGRSTPRSVAQSGRPAYQSAVGAPPFPSVEPVAPAFPGAADPLPAMPAAAELPPGQVSEAEANVSGRFRILKRLLDEGLVTPQEQASRRNANLGALLPYTNPPPATGLTRPIPREQAVVDRLKALGAALESRALSPREHAAERTVILEALLPAAPKATELPVLPPRDMIEAAGAVGRLERMRLAGLVTEDEATRERAAVEQALDRQLGTAPVEGSVTGLRHGKPAPAPVQGATPTGWGIHLASLTSEAAAHRSWDSLKARFPEQLGGLQPHFPKVAVKGKGTRWRVVAGPMESREAALKMCKALKLHRQFCDPLRLDP